jgi:O-antigen/teichoic acid export membrane protein
MTRTKEIVKQAGIYSSASVLTQLISVVMAIVTRRLIGPLSIGVWALVQVILMYADYAALGITHVVSREIPFYNGKGEPEKADEVKNIVYTFSILTSLMAAAGIFAFALIFGRQMPTSVFIGLCFASMLVVMQRLNDLLLSLLRAYKRFDVAAKQMVLSAIVNGILVAGMSYYFKLYGFLVAMCLSFVFNVLYVTQHQDFKFKFVWNWKKTSALIAFGFPLMMLSLFSTIFVTIDKIIITHLQLSEFFGNCAGAEHTREVQQK